MKKLKKFYINNRIYCILMLLSILCLCLIAGSVIFYFVNQTKSSVYGTRLENIEKYDTVEDEKKIKEYFEGNDKVIVSKVRIQGKIIYITYKVSDDAKLEDVTTIANSTLELISDENKTYYDVQYIIYRDSYDAYFGSKSSENTVITWAHTFDTTKNDEETKENTTSGDKS